MIVVSGRIVAGLTLACRLSAMLAVAQLAPAAAGESVGMQSSRTEPCVVGHRFEPGPIVEGHHRQPTRAEFEARTRELRALSANPCSARFGNPNVVNTGCGIVTNTSFSTLGANNCAAVNKEVDMVTVGFWQNIWKGGYGRVAAGAQWEYIQRKSFDTIAGNGGSVSTSDNVFLTSLRYYPF